MWIEAHTEQKNEKYEYNKQVQRKNEGESKLSDEIVTQQQSFSTKFSIQSIKLIFTYIFKRKMLDYFIIFDMCQHVIGGH